MIKREFKVNLKSFIIWLLVLISIFLVVYLIYPYIITDGSMKDMDELMKAFPEGVLKAFNMDMFSITTAYGWFKTEGFMFILLIIGFYSSMLGGSILLKEENDKTIEYLHSVPIKRSSIVMNKVIVGISYIVLMTLLFGIFNYIGLLLSGEFDHKEFVLLSMTPLLVGLPLFSINLFISTFMHRTRKTVGISLGLVFIFYVINVLSELSEKVEFLKYFSVYTLADLRNVLESSSINPLMVIISIFMTIIFIVGSYFNYEKKELV